MNRNDYFGQRRAVANRLEDFGYSDMALATGDQSRIAELQVSLDAKNDELVIAKALQMEWQLYVNNKTQALKDARDYQYGKNKLCSWTNTQKKCDEKRQAYERDTIQPLLAELNSGKTKLAQANAQISTLNQEINQITQEIATLLEGQKLEAQSTLTLAQQGKTPEQIKIEAQAQANAIAQKSKVDAEMKERKSKSRKIIILSIVLSAVLLTGLYVYYRIRKKAKAN